MKKIIAMLLLVSVLVVFGVGTFASSAETVDDLISKFEKNSPVAHYVIGDIKNIKKSVSFTDEQIAGMSKVLDEFLALGITDKGSTADLYSSAQVNSVVSLLDEFSSVSGITYEIKKNANSTHAGDVAITFYAPDGKKLLTYDGDVVSKTGMVETANTVIPVAIGSVCVVLAAVFAILASKKSKVGQPA